MGLFSERWEREHHLARDPEIDMHARADHPVQGDLLVWSDEYGKMIPATPPVMPNIGDTIADEDLIWWDDTDSQLEPVSPLDAFSAAAAYGSLSVLDGAATQAVTSTPAKLDAFAVDGPAALTVPDNTTDDILIGAGGGGDYEVQFNASFSYAAAAVVQFRLRVDAVESALGGQVEVLTGGDIVNVSFGGVVALADAEDVTVYVEASADDNITVIDAQLVIKRLHS